MSALLCDYLSVSLFSHLVIRKHKVVLILSFLSQGTVVVYKALVRMKLPLCMPGLGMHRLLNYPKVCLPKGWFTIAKSNLYSPSSSCFEPCGESFVQDLRYFSEIFVFTQTQWNYWKVVHLYRTNVPVTMYNPQTSLHTVFKGTIFWAESSSSDNTWGKYRSWMVSMGTVIHMSIFCPSVVCISMWHHVFL